VISVYLKVYFFVFVGRLKGFLRVFRYEGVKAGVRYEEIAVVGLQV
jgi:hypothetical protein